jgi:hypothetical protein
MQQAPKYSKIELILGSNNVNDPQPLVTHEDCGMFISGDNLVIVEDVKDNTGETNTVTEGTVYQLKNVKQYKTYAL